LTAAEETKQWIEEEGGTCSAFQMDVTRSQDCQAMSEHCLKTYGQIDILHNNVGILPPRMDPILEADEENWDLMMNVNLKSLFHTCRAVLPHMLKQGSGVILNISSVAAVKYHGPGFFSYSISKAGVNSFTHCLAYDLAEKGIRVNCIMPGGIDSPTVFQK
jgi:NAD(P)-dependent dehydrogenase (short-subunit alcohol dehydrogenase family)